MEDGDATTTRALSIRISTIPTPPLLSDHSPASSSAFVSALQSPYVSPRAPTTSDLSDFSVPDSAAARVSFSFPVPRATKGSVSPNAKLRSCDVYVGFHGHSPDLLRFCKWLKAELELQGIACFAADRASYSDSQSHQIADRVICSVAYGVVVVTASSFLNRLTVEEIRFFSQKKNLVPIFFDVGIAQSLPSFNYDKEAIDGLLRCGEFGLEADGGNWRQCISRAAGVLRAKLGRKSLAQKTDAVEGSAEEVPFPRNGFFVGREKEISEMEAALFGCGGGGESAFSKGDASGQSEGFADEESDALSTSSSSKGTARSFMDVDVEAWREGRCSARRAKPKKSKSGNTVICINGDAGIGKTELALEFAYRYAQRYKMVLWVGGEARYLRQNILNLALILGLDISADPEKERGRIRSFEEQEVEAFKRVKRELFRDMPYLLVIDNLESERDWWEGKDLHNLIPRNAGGSHVIITSRLSKVMNFESLHLLPPPLRDAMVLLRGRRKRDYPAQELDFLRKFDERLGRLTFGLWLVGSLLSELAITPSALFEAVNQVRVHKDSASIPGSISIDEEQFCKNNHFLMKLMSFCFTGLQQSRGQVVNRLASKMILVGAWIAPLPVSARLLGAAAENMAVPGNRCLRRWTESLLLRFCLAAQSWKSEEDSALLLAKLGLARRANRGATGCWIQFHPITQMFARLSQSGLQAAKATVDGVRRMGNPSTNSDHLWASAFLVFGFKSEPPVVQLKAVEMVANIRRTALPLAMRAFTTFSRCTSALELLKVCTNVLEEVEKSFVSQIQDWYCHGALCWKKKKTKTTTTASSGEESRGDEYVWQDVTLLKATLLETRAKLMVRGGQFDSAEELCRTCISIRTVMLGHNHAHTLAAQDTLAKLVRMRSKI